MLAECNVFLLKSWKQTFLKFASLILGNVSLGFLLNGKHFLEKLFLLNQLSF